MSLFRNNWLRPSVIFLILHELVGCATQPNINGSHSFQISKEVTDAIALCSAGYASSDAGVLSARLVSSGADIKGELNKIESGTLALSDVEMYKQYLLCIDKNYKSTVTRNIRQDITSTSYNSQHNNSNDTVASNVSHSVKQTSNGFEFTVTNCAAVGGSWVRCTVNIKNLLDKEQKLGIYNNYLSHFTSIYGSDGVQKKSTKMEFGTSSVRGYSRQVIPGGLSVNASFKFDGASSNMFPASIRIPLKNETIRESFSVVLTGINL
jgi:hypothetical protein